MHDQFGDHAVIMRWDRITGIDGAIEPDIRATWRVKVGNLAGRRHESLMMLGIDPAFDGVTNQHDVFLRERQFLAVRNTNLLTNEVDAGDHFRHRVLDLDPRIHLDEVEISILIEEFHRARAAIAHFLDCLGDNRADFLALSLIEGGRGRFLEYFLVSALQRTIALPQVTDIAMRVGDQLDFDMPWFAEIFIQIDCIIAKRCYGFGLLRWKIRRLQRPARRAHRHRSWSVWP